MYTARDIFPSRRGSGDASEGGIAGMGGGLEVGGGGDGTGGGAEDIVDRLCGV